MKNNINVRVYGLVVKENCLLALKEMYAGEQLIKFPGGGLEFGEGLIDCLKREFLEELNVHIQNIQHFYTQENFVVSRFRSDEALLTIYYLCELKDEYRLQIMDNSIDETLWLPITEENPMMLPVDREVYEKLKTYLERWKF